MALYERYDADGRKVERAFTIDGSDRDRELRGLAAAGLHGWKAADSDSDAEQGGDGPPAHAALKEEWEAYAVKQGLTADEATALTKAELIERFGRRKDGG